MPRDTTAHVRGGQAVPAHKHACVCVSQPLSSPTSTWIRAATTAAETSRPRCSLGGGTPSMQLLSHLCVAAIQWPIGMHRRHQATRHWTLARFRGHTLPSMKCLWHIGCTDPRHTALCCAPLSAAQQAVDVLVLPPPPTPRAAAADADEPSPRPHGCCFGC